MSAPRDHSTTNASSSQENILSTIVSSIASTLPPKPPTGPTLGDNINEDGEGDGDGGENGGGGDEGGGGEGGGEGINQWKPLSKGNAPCWQHFDKDSSQKVLTQSFMTGDGKKKLEAYTFDQNFARRELACMIIMHEYPLSMGEHTGFKSFVLALQPLFQMVSRNTLKADIFKIYDGERLKAMKAIEKIQSRVAVTTDMWTSSNQKRGFMVITGHYVDDSWKLQSIILRFIYVPCPHTAEVLCESLMETLLDWNIDRRLSTLTVDNCSSNDAMISILIGKLEPESLMSHGKLIHMRCVAHILNLIVKDGLEVIKGGIEKIRESVAYWTASPKREEKFEENARQLRILGGKKLSLDCVTRWNSTFLMLQTAIEYKDVFSRLKIRESQYKSCPQDSDWEVAKEVCERLEVCYKATEVFSGTKYPTSNLFFAKVCRIKMALTEWAELYERNEMEDLYTKRKREMMREMAAQMIEKYEKYWTIIHSILGVAAVLDPRFKMKLVEYYFNRIYGEGAIFEIERVHNYCKELLKEYEVKLNNGGIASSCQVESTMEVDDDLSDFDVFVTSNQTSQVSTKKSELDRYLEEDVIPRGNQDFDVLACTSGRVVTPHRSRLHPKTIEALMCARSWLLAQESEGNNSNEFASVLDDMDADSSQSCVTTVGD
ncbi:hypothetical protein RHGRI_017006 [Rhododendron griersonianum]|uniref:hAT-like transposase RNase-H fold domain-containing protein n=1 Tax=Rhododendron griersonianum TaxID=479676 RepID=A0AAV6JW68_9ERIC|nr:hypothetical protein RHGRI_017006 [Rhododendron griersonianum]